MEILTNPESSTRNRISAAKALIACEAQNQKDEQFATQQPDSNRFTAMMAYVRLHGSIEGFRAEADGGLVKFCQSKETIDAP